ncbi:MAG: GHKL domain-containing protein [Deltaproteobacteria bacterium]|nr:GHKL domain-containing protein [Deltaproteobacteria bacterium]
MEPSALPTRFAPAERLPPEEIQIQSAFFSNLSYLRQFADALPTIFVVLNTHRQIVFANQALADLAGKKHPQALYGLRPGEALNCVHLDEIAGGCGTTEFCRTCGAARAIVAAIGGKTNMQECRITTRNGEALDLRAFACPWTDGNEFISFALEDITHEKRRRALERIFFHDVLNTAGGVQGLAELLKEEADPRKAGELIDIIRIGAHSLIEEIQAQKALSAAETGELTVDPETVRADVLLEEVAGLYENHMVSKGRRTAIHVEAQPFDFTADLTILRRVLGNMMKNALEASAAGETVTLGARRRENRVEIWVHNPGFMPRDSQLQVFQRSFSTKGKGRGLGTYSIKLLTERYLNGHVSFTSTEAEGTTFLISLPCS